jgi:hypothetical protein
MEAFEKKLYRGFFFDQMALRMARFQLHGLFSR